MQCPWKAAAAAALELNKLQLFDSVAKCWQIKVGKNVTFNDKVQPERTYSKSVNRSCDLHFDLFYKEFIPARNTWLHKNTLIVVSFNVARFEFGL